MHPSLSLSLPSKIAHTSHGRVSPRHFTLTLQHLSGWSNPSTSATPGLINNHDQSHPRFSSQTPNPKPQTPNPDLVKYLTGFSSGSSTITTSVIGLLAPRAPLILLLPLNGLGSPGRNLMTLGSSLFVGFRVWGLGSKVWGLGRNLMTLGSSLFVGFRVWGLGYDTMHGLDISPYLFPPALVSPPSPPSPEYRVWV